MPVLERSPVVHVLSFQMDHPNFLQSLLLSHVSQIICFLVGPTIFRVAR